MLIVERKKRYRFNFYPRMRSFECCRFSSLTRLSSIPSLSLTREFINLSLLLVDTRERNSWRSIRFRSKLSPNNSKYNKYIAAMNLDCIFTLHFPITFLFKLSNPVLSSAVNNLSLSTRTRSRIYLEIRMK